jgi:DNA polymerase III delta subunit
MIIALTGQNTFRSRRELARLKQGFLTKYDSSGLNTVTLRDDTLTFEALQSAATAQGLLSPRRFVAVEGATSAGKDFQQQILTLLEGDRIPPEHIVVFWDETAAPDPRRRAPAASTSPLAAHLARLPLKTRAVKPGQSYRQDFPQLSGRLLEHAVTELADAAKAHLTPTAVTELIAYTQGDLWHIANVVKILSHAVPSGDIDVAKVREYVHAEADADMFQLMDAVSGRQLKKALALLEESFAGGEHPLGLLAMLQRQFRILALVRDAATQQPSPNELARTLKLHPFVVQKSLSQVRGFSAEELRQANARLLEIEMQSKSSSLDPRLLITTFVAEVARS